LVVVACEVKTSAEMLGFFQNCEIENLENKLIGRLSQI